MMDGMRKVVFFFVVFLSLFPLQVKAGENLPAGQDEQGYLEPPKLLSGLWENQKGPQYFIKFISDGEYRNVSADTGKTMYYNYYKIIRITDEGLIYALVKRVKNPYHFDKNNILELPEQVREMTVEEIAKAPAEYFYVLFAPAEYSEVCRLCDMSEGYFTIYEKICANSLKQNGITLSQDDFARSATEHWDRVRPGGLCRYKHIGGSGNRPEYDSYDPYGFWPEDDKKVLLPWEARAELRKKREGEDPAPFLRKL